MAVVLMTGTMMIFSSCSKDDDDAPQPSKCITIKNGSTYTLADFSVVFWSEDKELAEIEKGQFVPGATITVEVPAGAVEYYMYTYEEDGHCYFSPDYDVKNTSLTLSTEEVGQWDSPSTPQSITIKNGSAYTLEDFSVVFVDSEGKQIAESDEMTFASGATIIVEVPTGAVKYYMWRHVDGEWLFSPDYYVKDTPLTLSKDSSLTLSTEGVGDWK